MDNSKVAEVTFLQIARYRYSKICQITRKSNGLHFNGLHAFSKVSLKLNEHRGSNIKSSLLKILTSGILQRAPNDLN